MRKYYPKPASLYITSASVLLIAFAATFIIKEYLSSLKIIMYSAIGLFWGLGLLFGVWLFPMYFRRTVIYISPSELTIHTGIIFLRREQMKISAVQYVTKISFPFARFSGFNFIAVRGLGASIMLPFLSSSDCDDIMAMLRDAAEIKT